MTFWEMLQLCKKMHEHAPFFNLNGNTYAALAIEASQQISIKNPQNQFLLEDNICNIIVGNISETEEKKLRYISEKLEEKNPPLEI